MLKDQELYQRLDEVVHYIWDPIGVGGIPEARDEYYMYLPEIYTRVKAGDKDKVLEYLKWVVSDRMEMIFDENRANQAINIMMHWKKLITEFS